MEVEIYAAKNEAQAAIVVSLLAGAEIKARVMGQLLNNAAGEIPAGLTSSPRVWVADADQVQARQLIQQWEQKGRQNSPGVEIAWTCPECETEIEVGFDLCWNCMYNPAAC